MRFGSPNSVPLPLRNRDKPQRYEKLEKRRNLNGLLWGFLCFYKKFAEKGYFRLAIPVNTGIQIQIHTNEYPLTRV